MLRRKKSEHNCFKEYKKLLVNKENEVKHLKSTFGVNLDIKCQSGLHQMQAIRGKTLTYPANTNTHCDTCDEHKLEEHEISYHCKECKFDMCHLCALIQAKVMQTQMYFYGHDCKMKRAGANRHGWACDARHLSC